MNLVHFLSQSTSGIGVFGAIVGGSGAAARNYKDVQEGLVTPQEAAYDTAKEATGAGVATAASAVVAGAVGGGLLLTIGTAVIAAAGAKYAWDRGMEQVDKKMCSKNADDLDEAIDSQL